MGTSDAAESNSMSDCSSTDDNSFEFRILMAYAQRTLPIDKVSKKLPASKAGKGKPDKSSGERSRVGAPHGVDLSQQAVVEPKPTDIIQYDGEEKSHVHKSRGKRNSGWKRLIPRCLLAAEANYEAPSAGEQGKSEEDEMVLKPSYKIALSEPVCKSEPPINEVAEKLQKIINSKMQMFTFKMYRSSSLEVDAGEDDQKAIDQIVAFLTTKGDSLDEEIKKDPQFATLFGEKSSFSFFKKVMDYVLQVALPAEMNSEVESETEGKLKIAFVVHATTRFAAVDNHPMARIMGFGTKYLQENFTTWVMQKGGWEKIMEEEHID
ncbi:apoptosis facilitator Bcl-2-like protein 14 [Heptranchias perlo]|uniref:apoptosis facilitator Bcl-2-like protein 14 n=1 Tax=Heptranchias perlo TaxID=212740 RepID=UPI003559E6CB